MKPDLAGTPTGRLTSELHLIAGRLAGGDPGNNDDLDAVPLTRIAHELVAVTDGTEQATQRILAAAEEIDQLANNLPPALKGKIEQGWRRTSRTWPSASSRPAIFRISSASASAK